MGDWLPISSAPKANLASLGYDSLVGPRIIVADAQREAEVYWCEPIEMDDGDGGVQVTPEGWVSVDEVEIIAWEPTRWKPAA